ncbi:hypothetical protein UFOVP1309_41 [uncultured Caudovirales phage]|uniref:Phage protein Gp138 N-terminal domain-containing protein n=1 Tax=uncultured Caudovirales phage TaxID=2100421 RepID=A0A6J5RKH7_9CAUD|nr:hypothetical protein UFOVP1309_41 [uncultured Caudovirales phage]
MAEQIDFVDALRKLIDSKTGEINTSLPGVIVSYANGRATVQPTPKRRFADGDVLPFPILQNVRVCWPSFAGGLAGVKGPVLPGDKCLIVFAQQAVDGSDDMRRFDISDAYVISCDLGTVGAGDSGNNADMTVFYGPGSIRISAGGAVTITAPGGVSIVAPSLTNNGTLLNSGLATMPAGATVDGIPFASHRHTGVQTGSGTTGGPTA